MRTTQPLTPCTGYVPSSGVTYLCSSHIKCIKITILLKESIVTEEFGIEMENRPLENRPYKTIDLPCQQRAVEANGRSVSVCVVLLQTNNETDFS